MNTEAMSALFNNKESNVGASSTYYAQLSRLAETCKWPKIHKTTVKQILGSDHSGKINVTLFVFFNRFRHFFNAFLFTYNASESHRAPTETYWQYIEGIQKY